jgi:OmpA-OmpF porin, OOP family
LRNDGAVEEKSPGEKEWYAKAGVRLFNARCDAVRTAFACAGSGRGGLQRLAADFAISREHDSFLREQRVRAADMPIADDGTTKHVEGDYHYWDIGTREGTSDIQVFRNFQNGLKSGGFTVDYTQSPGQIVAHKGATWIFIDNRGSFYYQTIVTVKEMKQEVVADASSLSDEIKKTGHVAVYGIHFDTGKATILPDSEDTLKQIATLLQNDSSLKLMVEGHTDNQGNAAANLALSERRATSVVAWLTAHGAIASRLSAKGFGQTEPVADNSTDDGRAKNRRVELAQQK